MPDDPHSIGHVESLSTLFAVFERMAIAAEAQAAALERIAAGMSSVRPAALSSARRAADERSDLELQALVLLAQQDATAINVTAIAKRLGITRQSLHRLPRFSAKLAELKAWVDSQGRQPRRGYRRDGGDIEAIDD